jgi:hypothetical protein
VALPAVLAGFLGRAATASAGSAGARAAAGNAAPQSLDRLNQGLQRFTQRVRHADSAIAGLAGMMGGRLTHSLTAAIDAVSAFAAPIERLSRLANPAQADQFVIALEDAQAVIGRMLLPVLRALTRVARAVGDHFAAMEPVIGPLLEKIGGFIEHVMAKIGELAQRNAPLVEMMVDALMGLVDGLTVAVDAIFFAMDKLMRIPRFIARQFGYGGENGKADFRRSSVGAAARPAQFIGAKAVSDEAIKHAITLAATGQKAAKPPEKTLENIESELSKFFAWAMGKGSAAHQGKAAGGQQSNWWADAAGALRQLATAPF